MNTKKELLELVSEVGELLIAAIDRVDKEGVFIPELGQAVYGMGELSALLGNQHQKSSKRENTWGNTKKENYHPRC